ncbi:MAG: EamA family transporter [Gammaproteobacteria bacterium]
MNTTGALTKHTDVPALIALVALAFLWGYNWVAMKVGLAYAAPFDFVALRTMLGGICLLLVLAVLRRPLRPHNLRGVLWLGFFQTTLFTTLAFWSLVHGGAGKAAVLCYTMPFWVILLAVPFLGERMRGLQWLAVLVALIGMLCIFEPWHRSPDLVSSILAVLAGATWGASVIVAKKIPVKSMWELVSLTGWQMLFGGIPIVLIAWWLPSHPIHWSGAFIWSLFYNVIPANALAWLLWLYVLQRLSASVSGLCSLAVPVVGVLAAWLQLGEHPDRPEAVGMTLIIIALALLSATAFSRGITAPGRA